MPGDRDRLSGSQGPDIVGLTGPACRATIVTVHKDKDEGYAGLDALRYGKPVLLFVDSFKESKRQARVSDPGLFLIPLTVYGVMTSNMLIGLQSRGCEVVDTRHAIKPIVLYRAGVPYRAAKVLAEALTSVFSKGERNGKASGKRKG